LSNYSCLEGKFKSRTEFVAATLEVQQIDIGGDGQVASGEFAGVASAESARVHELVLSGDTWASGGFVSNSHAGGISGVLGGNSQNSVVVKFVENGEVGITVAGGLEDGVDGSLLHGKSDVFTGAGGFFDAVTSRKTNIKVLMSKNSIQTNLWSSRHSRVNVQVQVVLTDVLLEFTESDSSFWGERTGQNSFSETGSKAGLGDFKVQSVVGVPGGFHVKVGEFAFVVGFYATFDGGRSDVLVSFDDEVHAFVFVFELELDFAEVVVLFEEIITGFSEVVKFLWSHFKVRSNTLSVSST